MIIARYLIREVMAALFAVITILLLAFLSQQVVRYLNYVAIGKIPTNVLLQLVSFEIPYLLALLLPLGVYLGILLAYGRLYADNEMSVLLMCGFNDNRIMRITALLGMMVAAVVLVLMLWVNPDISAKRQQIMQSDEATLHLIQTMMPGRFQVSPDGRNVIYVEKLSRDHQQAENVFIAKAQDTEDTSGQPVWALVSADQGYQMKDKASNTTYFVTNNGFRYEGVPGENDYKLIQFKKYGVMLPQNDMHISHMQDEALSIKELLQGYGNPKRAAEFQWRISIGISALLLALLAVPLSTVRPRHGRYLILLPAILVYILYVNLLFVSRHWIEQGIISTTIGMWWVHILVLLGVISAFYIRFRAGR